MDLKMANQTNTPGNMTHGGDAQSLGLDLPEPENGWLDLSTGIAPYAYPVGDIPENAWTALPQQQAERALIDAASEAFGCSPAIDLCLGPGSQALIQILPKLLPTGTIAVQTPTYGEHAYRWARAGHDVTPLRDVMEIPADARYLVVTNPNNPTGEVILPSHLMVLADEMQSRDGYLIVDEAFADIVPDISMMTVAGRPGLIILRSFGKFFGLAGLRVGFLAGPKTILEAARAEVGPWSVNGPALEVARQAYRDHDWIEAQRRKLATATVDLRTVLAAYGNILGGTDLFQLVESDKAQEIFLRLAKYGILVRRFDNNPNWLRFGLPRNDAAFHRLKIALED
jgi:cobalamin biosynthesis protein CobC